MFRSLRVLCSVLFVCLAVRSGAADVPVSEARVGVPGMSFGNAVGAFHGGEFLIAWTSNIRGTQVMRLDPAGNPLTSTSVGLPMSWPLTVFWRDGMWFVVSGAGYMRLSADGVALDRQETKFDTVPQNAEAATWTGEALIIAGSNDARDEHLAWTYDADFKFKERHLLGAGGPGGQRRRIYAASDGRTAALFYQVGFGAMSYPLVGALFNRDGELIDRYSLGTDSSLLRSAGARGEGYLIVTAPRGGYAWFTSRQFDGQLTQTGTASFGLQRDYERGYSPVLPWDGSSNSFFYSAGGNVRVARIFGSGTHADDRAVEVVNGFINPFQDGLTAVAGGGSTLLLYKRARTASGFDRYLHARAGTDPRSFASAEDVGLERGALEQEAPAVSTTATQALVAWREREHPDLPMNVYATRLTRAGDVLDPQSIRVGTSTCEGSLPGVGTDGRDYLVAWHQNLRLMTMPVRADGSHPDTPTRTLSLPGCSWARPAVLSNGTDYLVAAFYGNGPVQAMRVRRDGTLIDSTPLVLGGTSPAQVTGASNGQDYLVAWNGGAARVTAGGTVLDHPAIALDGAAGPVWWNGSSYSVVVTKGSSTRIQRIGTDGVVTAAGAPFERSPGEAWGRPATPACDRRGCTVVTGEIVGEQHRFIQFRYADDGVTASITARDGDPVEPLLPHSRFGSVVPSDIAAFRLPGGKLFAAYVRRVFEAPFSGMPRVLLRPVDEVRARTVRH